VYHEEAPILARPAEVPDGLRPLTGRAVDKDIEIDDGDAAAVEVPAACYGTCGEYGWVVHVLAGLRCRVRRRRSGRLDWAVEEHEAEPSARNARVAGSGQGGCRAVMAFAAGQAVASASRAVARMNDVIRLGHPFSWLLVISDGPGTGSGVFYMWYHVRFMMS
jgi:hypothetical protein